MSHSLSSYERAQMLRGSEVAERLGISRRTVWRLADAGELPRVRVGARAVRYRVQDVAALIERGLQNEHPAADRVPAKLGDEAADASDCT